MMADQTVETVYSLLTEAPASDQSAAYDDVIRAAETNDLIVALALASSLHRASQLAAVPDSAKERRYASLSERFASQLEARGVTPARVLIGETLRSWSDLLVRQDRLTDKLTQQDAAQLQDTIGSIESELGAGAEAAEARLVFQELLDALDAFSVTR